MSLGLSSNGEKSDWSKGIPEGDRQCEIHFQVCGLNYEQDQHKLCIDANPATTAKNEKQFYRNTFTKSKLPQTHGWQKLASGCFRFYGL